MVMYMQNAILESCANMSWHAKQCELGYVYLLDVIIFLDHKLYWLFFWSIYWSYYESWKDWLVDIWKISLQCTTICLTQLSS